jgi:hypothetical protein
LPWGPDFSPFRYLSRSGIAGSNGNSIFMNLHSNFHNECSNLYLHCVKGFPFLPMLSNTYLCFCFCFDNNHLKHGVHRCDFDLYFPDD